MSEVFLEVRNLSLTLDGHQLLANVSLSVERGELCCLIGPNGAGKSTLLKCIDRLYDGWTGTVSVKGEDVGELSRRALSQRIGYVPQCRESLPDFRVDEFLAMSRYACGGSGAGVSRIVSEALSRVGMSGFSGRRLGSLSGGECQKVFIAAGLVQGTPLLLLDEPTAYLDPRYQVEVNTLLSDLSHQDGVTVVCVSHDVNSALLYADRLVGLKGGRLAYECVGSSADISCLETLFETSFARCEHPEKSGLSMVLPRVQSFRC